MSAFATRAIMTSLAVATTCVCGTGSAQKSGEMMQESTRIESLVLQLASTDHSVGALVQLLGDRFSESEGEYTVHIGKRPFESAIVSRFENRVRLAFTLLDDRVPLGEITGDTEAWVQGPLAPDSGQRVLHRDWDSSGVTIRCVLRMADIGGERPEKDDLVQSVGCHIYLM